MSNSSLRIWSFEFSPFAAKVRAAFAEKEIPYEIHEINPGKRPSRLAELNSWNRVPVLEVGDEVLTESAIICDWIEETHPEPALWPSDPVKRAQARATAYWIDEQVTKVFFLSMRKLAYGPAENDPEDIVEQLQHKTMRRWPLLEEMLEQSGGPWVCGDQFTYADLGAMPSAVRIPLWVPAIVPNPDETPLVAKWFEALRERPSAAAVLAKGDPVHSSDDD
jgi:glutathione S-transferase